MDTILSRRSIRKYTDEPVAPKDLADLMRAAMAAPSAHNQQPWQFVIIDDRAVLDEIPKFHENARMLTGAPVAILVCGDREQMKVEDVWVQDCSAATENILLAAHAKGLGAVWLGIYPKEERIEKLKGMLQLPQNVIPFALISLGHPEFVKRPSNRFEPSRIRYNRWDNLWVEE